MADKISLKIPAKAEYITSLRLLFAGLSSKSLFDIEMIEDIKVIAVEFLNMAVREEKENLELEINIESGSIDITCPVKFDPEDDLSLKIMESLCNHVSKEEGFVKASFRKEK